MDGAFQRVPNVMLNSPWWRRSACRSWQDLYDQGGGLAG